MKKGKLRFYPYNINWNYGLLPQTWEDPAHKAEDVGGVAARPRARARPELRARLAGVPMKTTPTHT